MKINKKTIFIALAILACLLIACSSLIHSQSSSTNVTTTNVINKKLWQAKAPQLFSNIGYSKLVESTNNNPTGSPSQNRYIGKVTNPFGIRDDVLEFILSSFPKNESAIYAAIRNEQYELLIFNAETDKEAVKYANDGGVAIWCLGNAIGDINADKFYDALNDVRLSTPEGKNIDKVVRRKLAWKIWGFGHKSTIELDSICNKGAY